MVGCRADAFLQIMDRVEQFTLGRAWNDLTDDEFFWEPTPTTWTVRRREDCRTGTPFGDGDYVVDFELREPRPTPMTSIAWLAWHVGSMPGRLVDMDFLRGDRTMASGWSSPYLSHHAIFTGADEAMAALRDGWFALRSVVERTTDDQFETLAARYTYANSPMRDGLCVLGPPGPEH